MSELTIPGVLARAAEEAPDAEAVVDGDVRVTYAELRERVREAAGAFAGSGIAPGDRIAIWAPNSLSWIVTVLGAMGAGATLVPLNTRFKGDEARWPLSKARVKLLFVEDGFLGADYPGMLGLDESGEVPGLPDLQSIVTFNGDARPGVVTWAEFTGRAVPEEADARAAAVAPGDVADILFTSGTTGRPKGVMCTHEQNIRTYQAWTGWTGVPGRRPVPHRQPVVPLLRLQGGLARVRAQARHDGARSACSTSPETLRIIERERITVLPGPPTIYTSLLDPPSRAEHDLSSLRLAVTGAADVPGRAGAADEVRAVPAGRHRVRADRVVRHGDRVPVDDDDETIATTCGRPIPDVEVAIVDEKGERVPPGKHGEVLVRGYNVMRGYLDDPEATAATVDADGWLHTGDSGRSTSAATSRITGRTKDMFVVGGFNVYPAEVEDVLARHDAVAESRRRGRPRRAAGGGGPRLRPAAPRPRGHRRGAHRALPGAARQLQGAPGGRLRGRPPEDRVRQGPPRRPQRADMTRARRSDGVPHAEYRARALRIHSDGSYSSV